MNANQRNLGLAPYFSDTFYRHGSEDRIQTFVKDFIGMETHLLFQSGVRLLELKTIHFSRIKYAEQLENCQINPSDWACA